MYIKQYKPYCEVTFFTEKTETTIRMTPGEGDILDQDIVSVSTFRDMGADAPTFSINLTRRKPWHKLLAPNDLVVITMCRPPFAPEVVMYGLVDDCRKHVSISGNSPQRVITVTGRGFAKAFIRFDTGIVPEADVASNGVGYLVAHGVRLSGAQCSDIMNTLWENICKKFINYDWGNGKTLFSIANKVFYSYPKLILLDSSSLENYQGSLWSLMREVTESPFYELFWEVRNNTPFLYSRPTPFNKEDWSQLAYNDITDEDVVNDDIGRSDLETYTIFSVGCKTLFSDNDPYKTLGTRPLWYEPYSKKYGISRLHVESLYTGLYSSTDVTGSSEAMRTLQTNLYNWNIHNRNMYNGTFTLQGHSKYKIGEKLIYDSKEEGVVMEYYTTSVAHNFDYYNKWVTNIEVVRGMEPKDRFSDPWDKYTEYSGIGLGLYNPEEALQQMQNSSSFIGPPIGSADATLGLKVVDGAKSLKGKVRYVFGADNPTRFIFDCSSFTKYVYKMYAGIDIGRTTDNQVRKGSEVSSIDALQPGDLVLFKNTYNSNHLYGVSHVGIYIGNKQFIHNADANVDVIISNLDKSYWKDHFLMGRRILATSYTGGMIGGSSDAFDFGYTTISDSKINSLLGGVVAKKANLFIDAGRKYNVDPNLTVAICMLETGHGTSNAIRNYNNPGGLMSPSSNWKELTRYSSLTKGIEAMTSNLRRTYLDQGLRTLSDIQKKYAPVGADNDPNGTNKYWLVEVSQFYNQLTK